MVFIMEITACPVCGSKNIGIGTLGDGIISGLSSWNEVCRNCGYQGASLVFESESQYNKFLDALSNQKKQNEEKVEEINDENTGHETDGKQLIRSVKKSYVFEFIVSIILVIIFFIILSISSYFGVHIDIFSQSNFSSFILYILSSFIGVFLFFFLLIVFVEILYRSIWIKKK